MTDRSKPDLTWKEALQLMRLGYPCGIEGLGPIEESGEGSARTWSYKVRVRYAIPSPWRCAVLVGG